MGAGAATGGGRVGMVVGGGVGVVVVSCASTGTAPKATSTPAEHAGGEGRSQGGAWTHPPTVAGAPELRL